jgi:hypothetical protein
MMTMDQFTKNILAGAASVSVNYLYKGKYSMFLNGAVLYILYVIIEAIAIPSMTPNRHRARILSIDMSEPVVEPVRKRYIRPTIRNRKKQVERIANNDMIEAAELFPWLAPAIEA